jgi:hypothetical protein
MRFHIGLSRALAISLLWHLMCFLGIVIVIVPAGTGQKRLAEVYFLGSLLDKNVFGSETAQAEGFSITERRPVVDSIILGGSLKYIDPKSYSNRNTRMLKKPYHGVVNPVEIKTEKISADISVNEGARALSISISQIQGAAYLNKPKFIPILRNNLLPANVSETGPTPAFYNMELLAIVDSSGGVREAELVGSSGSPYVDRIIEDYVKKWLFEPSDANNIQQDESIRVYLEVSY